MNVARYSTMFRDEIRTGWACSAIDDQTLGAQNWTISTILCEAKQAFRLSRSEA